MVGRSNGLRLLVTGIGGLWIAVGLSGCVSVSSQFSSDGDTRSPSKRTVSDKGAGVSETFQKTYKAVKVKTLRVRDEMGAIEIKPEEDGKDEIRIEATKTLEGGDLSASDL